MHEIPAESRLGRVDVGTVALRVDEWIRRVPRGGAGDELAVPAPPSCMAGHPDVRGEAPQQAEAALEVGPLLWIPHPPQRSQIASAHDVQHAVTAADGERPRGAAARVAACDVRDERERPDADRVAVLEPVVDTRGRIAEEPDPHEGPQRPGPCRGRRRRRR